MLNPIIFVKNKAQIVGIPEVTVKKISQFLTMSNPLWQQGLNLGLTNWGVPKQLQYFEDATDNSVVVPVGALNDVIQLIMEDCEFDLEDMTDVRNTRPLPDYFSKVKFKPTLRDYQQEMIDHCKTKTVGVIQAKTGAGKTLFALSLILEKQEPTLFLVNTLELANQAIASFVKHTNLAVDDIGLIGNGKFSLKPITVGLHQTMARLSEPQMDMLNGHIGMVIADEVHICPAKTYYKTMVSLDAKYKWGISGTPKREDGLTRAIFFATGPLIYSVPESKLESVLITPDVIFIETDYTFPLFSTQDYQPMITDLSEDKVRNNLILEELKKYKGRPTVLLCSRISQVEALKESLGDEAVMLTSESTKKRRKEVMESLQNNEKSIVISTYGLFSTGIDLPHLEVLFLCAPMKSEIKLRQAAGRLMRKADGKTSARIVDFVDKRVGVLFNQSRKRKTVLNNL
ncbi:MAG: DEAD/DEAH box helicase [Rhodobacteraceae bacterium]|nr:DEAD/DEAH box helicase [Paracoccaceae bacterium]